MNNNELLTYDDLMDFESVDYIICLWNCYCDDINMQGDKIFNKGQSWITFNGGMMINLEYSSDVFEYLSIQKMVDWYNQKIIKEAV
jgi:hypothetical protein